MITCTDIVKLLRTARYPMDTEKILQAAIETDLRKAFGGSLKVDREFHFDKRSIIDFLINDSIGIEVKIGGSKIAVYKQMERYAKDERVSELLLITNKAMGFPKQINGKDCYVLKLGIAWL